MKRKHKEHTKLVAYPKLYKKARAVFAAWIRNRDPFCITCGAPTQNAGHYIHKNCFDFSEYINHGQCIRCNKWLHGNLAVYTLKMIQLYGHDSVEQMHRESHEVVKFSREFLENVIQKYSFKREVQ